jgi:hypothetical protein
MLRWWGAKRRQRQAAIRAAADAYMDRHGWHAYRFAGDRAIDAYLLGDLAELERWSDIRAVIRDTVAPGASPAELSRLNQARPPEIPRLHPAAPSRREHDAWEEPGA